MENSSVLNLQKYEHMNIAIKTQVIRIVERKLKNIIRIVDREKTNLGES